MFKLVFILPAAAIGFSVFSIFEPAASRIAEVLNGLPL